MKFNVEIDLEWIGDDSSIDEMVKTQIIEHVENRVLNSLQKQVKESMDERIETQVKTMIESGVNERVTQLMTLPRTSTDKYGQVVKADFTIESLLIESIDAALTKKTLGSDGRAGGYDAKFTYFEYFATKDIPALVDKKVKELGASIEKTIHNLVEEKIKTQIADKLTALIVDNSTALSLRK